MRPYQKFCFLSAVFKIFVKLSSCEQLSAALAGSSHVSQSGLQKVLLLHLIDQIEDCATECLVLC